MGNELVATYYYNHKSYDVYGCWDKETPENEFDFYDLYRVEDGTSTCINEGDPFFVLPTRDEVIEYVK